MELKYNTAMKKKVFASDFDNTLHFQDGFHKKDLEAIKKFQSEGNLFGLCTGRSLMGSLELTEGALSFDFLITVTGACIFDGSKKVLFRKTVKEESWERFLTKYEALYHPVLNTGYQIYSHYDDYGKIEDYSSLDDFKEGLCGVSFYAGEKSDLVREEINREFKGEIEAYANGPFIDAIPYGCSKGEGIKELKKILGVEEIAGMGDAKNDLPLLKEAHPSFTFPSSPMEVKSVVTAVVPCLADAIVFVEKN